MSDWHSPAPAMRALASSLLAFVAWQSMAPPSPAQQPAQPRRTTTDPRYVTQELQKAPELPYIPTYAGRGAILMSGLYYPHLQEGQCYHLRYLSREDARQVLDWYRSALSSNGWKLVPSKSESMLTANRDNDGLTVFIVTQRSPRPEYKSMFMLRYLQSPPKIQK